MSNALTTTDRSFMPAMRTEEAHARYAQIMEFVKGEMKPEKDYGIVPGTTKPTLLKPGAEKLCTFFGLSVEDPEIVTSVEDWTGEKHGGEPLFYYQIRQRLTRCGELVSSQIGSCNSWEKKYRYRQLDRLCPGCGKPAIIKGRQEYGGGWICFKKRGGCGGKFRDGDPSIEGQQVGQTVNKDIADQVNTIQKMAQKRALIAAVLIAANASEFFTQDIEDIHTDSQGEIIDATAPARPEGKKRSDPPIASGADGTRTTATAQKQSSDQGTRTTPATDNRARTAMADTPSPVPNSSAQEASKITIDQFRALCEAAKDTTDINASRKAWHECLTRYGIKKMENLPAVYFGDALSWLQRNQTHQMDNAMTIRTLADRLGWTDGEMKKNLKAFGAAGEPEQMEQEQALNAINFLQRMLEKQPAGV